MWILFLRYYHLSYLSVISKYFEAFVLLEVEELLLCFQVLVALWFGLALAGFCLEVEGVLTYDHWLGRVVVRVGRAQAVIVVRLAVLCVGVCAVGLLGGIDAHI